MEYVYLWEIDGQVRLGISAVPSEELRLLESELHIRATLVFTARLTQSLDRAVRELLSLKRRTGAGSISLTFEQTKRLLTTSIAQR